MKIPALTYADTSKVKPFLEWLDCRYLESCNMAQDIEHSVLGYIEYEVWTYEDPKSWLLDRYALDQIGHGLNEPVSLFLPMIPVELKQRSLKGMLNIFELIFEPNLQNELGHLNEINEEMPLASACYMWWEYSNFYVDDSNKDEYRNECLRLYEYCLKSSKAALQESALHGIGHAPWTMKPLLNDLHQLVLDYLKSSLVPRPELAIYAEIALKGAVQ